MWSQFCTDTTVARVCSSALELKRGTAIVLRSATATMTELMAEKTNCHMGETEVLPCRFENTPVCATVLTTFLPPCLSRSSREFEAVQEFDSGSVQAVSQVAGLQGTLPDGEQLCRHFKHHPTGSCVCLCVHTMWTLPALPHRLASQLPLTTVSD